MARWTNRPSRRPCKSRRFVIRLCCCCCNCSVGVGVSPNGTLDKQTFKKALQVKKVRGPALSLLVLLLVVSLMMLVLVLVADCTKRHSRKRCKSRRFVQLCRCCCCGGGGGGGGVSPYGTLDKETFKNALQVKKVRSTMSLLLFL